MPKILVTAFDNEFCDEVTKVLGSKGAHIHCGDRVVSIDGNRQAGLRIVENGSIWVDEYMRTDAEDVFAVGDCAVKRDFFTRKAAPVWLASTATAEARNAGTNIYGIRVLHQIQGTIAAFSTKIGGISLDRFLYES